MPLRYSIQFGSQGRMVNGNNGQRVEALRSNRIITNAIFNEAAISKDFPVLAGINEWTPNENLSVITGINGIGKTQILDYIATSLKQDGHRFIYIKSSFVPNFRSIGFLGELTNEFITRFKNSKHQYLFEVDMAMGIDNQSHLVREKFRQKVLSDIKKIYYYTHKIDDLNKIKQHSDFKQVVIDIVNGMPIQFMPETLTSNDVVSILDTVFEVYKSRNKESEALAEINNALISFKHEAYRPGNRLAFRKKGTENEKIDPEKFSSGEKLILTILALKYSQSGFPTLDGNAQHGDQQVNFILLDEPDKHFHPKFIKELYTVIKDTFIKNLQIQVIFTTHNPSTVALADDRELFVMEQKGDEPTRIKQCTKLLALAKLSKEIQTYTGMHVKVYTESFDDAKFYEGIYANLMKYSDIIRENKLQGIAVADPFLDELSTLSRRYQMGFYPASFEAGKDGGWKKVFDAVRISVAAQDAVVGDAMYSDQNSFVANLFRAYRVDAPFGIIDRDYENNLYKKAKDDDGNERFILPQSLCYKFERLERHSLECFMCDPVLLCSIFNSADEIDNWLDFSGFKMHLKSLYRELFSINRAIDLIAIQARLNLLYIEIFKACLKEQRFIKSFKEGVKKAIYKKYSDSGDTIDDYECDDTAQIIVDAFINNAKVNDATQEYELNFRFNKVKGNSRLGITDVTEIAKYLIMKHNHYFSKFSKSEGLREVYNSMRNELVVGLDLKPIDIIFKDQNEIKVITIQYPTSLKALRGHNLDYALREYFVDEFNGVKFKDMMLSRIMHMSLDPNARLIIPEDLAQIIINLNYKIKMQIIEKADYEKFQVKFLGLPPVDYSLKQTEKYIISVTSTSHLLQDVIRNNYIEIVTHQEEVSSQLPGTIILLLENNHILFHKMNILSIIEILGRGASQSKRIVCIERKQHGNNLGMSDVIALAKCIEQGNTLPSELQHLPIYYDSILYNAAKAKGIQVIGIEGKGLVHSKKSPYYHQAREEYMAEQLLAIAKSGKNAIFLVGSAHINNLIKLLGAQGFRVDDSDSSLGQNLITLKPNPAIFTRELLLPEISTDLLSITNYEHNAESNPQLESKNIVHEVYESYSFLSYIYDFTKQLDLNWKAKKLLHLTDLAKFEVLKAKYGITASFDAFRGRNSEFRKSVLLKLHPDKNPGNPDCNDDFVFVTKLREELSKPLDVQKFINERIQTIQPLIYTVNVGLKFFDTAVDVARLVYMPTVDNAQKTLMDVAHIYSMNTGINGYSALITSYDVIYKVYEGEYTQAISHAATSMSYMLLPTMIASFGTPYTGFVYTIGLTIYTGYHTVLNAHSFYYEFNQKDFTLSSNLAYQNIAEKLSTTYLQNFYDFTSIAKEYEKAAYKLKLEEKGEFGQKLYEYIYSRAIEEKYDLQNNLKSKHIKLMEYDHCMEIVELKEKESDHYYCYNEEQQILDHIIIIGNSYVEKIGSL